MRKWSRAITTMASAVLMLSASTALAHPIHLPNLESVQIVVDGVDNPRSLAFDGNGDLYIAAAGAGGTDACTTNDQGLFCSGLTGAVLKVAAADIREASLTPAIPMPVVSGLISMAYPGGSIAHGLHGIAAKDGQTFVVFIGPELIGTAGSETCCQASVQGELREAALAQLGNLMTVSNGTLVKIADVDHFEYTENPVSNPESNPYAVAIDHDGSFVIADAAGNTIVRAQPDGSVSLVAALDDIISGPEGQSIQTVPTGIAIGPDGNYYVSLLAGFHPGFARIVRITPQGVVKTLADGLSMLTSIAMAPGGTLYATEYSNGDLVRVRPDPETPGAYLPAEVILRGQFVTPTAVTVGPDGWVYVSDAGTFPGSYPVINGKIVRFKG
ncbi:MAG: ScyD/ScyE family protein [Actinomycetota bacterium]